MWLIGWLAASLTASPFASVYQWSKVLAGRAGPRPAGAAPRAHACLAAACRPGKRAGFVLTGWLAHWLAGWLAGNGPWTPKWC